MSGPEPRPRGRLRRSDCSGPGIGRRRRGSGFSYHDPEDGPVRDEDTLERIRALAIPPAWREEYAETNESYGVATVLRAHVTIEGEEVVFDFPPKSGQRRVQSIRDSEVKAAVEAMAPHEGRGGAGDPRRGQACRRAPRQHPCRLPQLLHRPAGARPVPRRQDDRAFGSRFRAHRGLASAEHDRATGPGADRVEASSPRLR